MFGDAPEYLKCFSANGGDPTCRHYWNMMSKSIIRMLRFYPSNVKPEEALNLCEKKVNHELFRSGKLNFCSQCDDFDNCTVTAQIKEFVKYSIMLYINLKPLPKQKLSSILGDKLMSTFLTKFAKSVGDDYHIDNLDAMKIAKSHF